MSQPTAAAAASSVDTLAALTAELLAAFFLVFCGTGAIVIDALSGGALGTPGIALAFGLAVMAVIAAFGDVSGAHANPAVTVAFWLARRFPGRRVLPYVLMQCAGALAASLMLRVLFPGAPTLGLTAPQLGLAPAVAFEAVMSAFLMLVILGVAHGARERGLMAAIAIGGVVALEAAFGGPVSGASMNPARSLGPALASGEFAYLWLYLVVPTVAMAVAVAFCAALRGPACCGGEAGECR